MTFINTPDAMKWLLETHVKDLAISWEPRSALIVGNEDCPDEIHLWPARNPVVADTPLIGHYRSDTDTYEFCGPLQREEAMKIDAQERKEPRDYHFDHNPDAA